MNQRNLFQTTKATSVVPKVAVAHLGSRWNYDIPVILQRLGLLTCFYTDAYCGPGSWLSLSGHMPYWLTQPALRRLQARARLELQSDKVKAFNALGLKYSFYYSQTKTYIDRLRVFLEINQQFNRLVCKHQLPLETNIFLGMNTATMELFEYLQGTSIKKLMDQNILPMQVETKILMEEHDRWSDWTVDRYRDCRDEPIYQQWVEREEREWQLADLILCASPRTVEALQSCGVPKSKCRVIPYPVDSQAYAFERIPRISSPLRILFVGQVNLRKGIPYFLQMLKQLPPKSFEARVVGGIQVKSEVLNQYSDVCTFTGVVPRSEMYQHYAWADVFVFPSLCDSAPGSTNEALAAGLPVVTTLGAGTVVEDGVSGWIVADRDVEALVNRVMQLIEDRDLLAQMSLNARQQVKKIDTAAYGKQLKNTCESLLIRSNDTATNSSDSAYKTG